MNGQTTENIRSDLREELKARCYPQPVIESVENILKGLNAGMNPGRFGGKITERCRKVGDETYVIKVGYAHRMFVKQAGDAWRISDVMTRDEAGKSKYYADRR